MNFISEEFSNALGLTIIDAFWQGALLLIVALIFISLFKQVSPRIKYRLIVAVMLAMPIWSLISFNNHYIPISNQDINVPAVIMPESFASNLLVQQLDYANTETPNKFQLALRWIQSNADTMAYCWLIGIVLFGIRLMGGLLYVQTLSASAIDIIDEDWTQRIGVLANQLKIKQRIRFAESVKVNSPIVIGYLKPIVLFPIGLIQGMPTDQVEAILTHEIAHIKRADFLINILLSALKVVYFFHPAYWWLYAQAEQEREYHCDLLTIGIVGNKLSLIKALASIQESKLPSVVPASTFAKGKNQLLERIIRITEGRPRTNWLSGIMSLIVMLTGFVLVSWTNVQKEPFLEEIKSQEVINNRILEPKKTAMSSTADDYDKSIIEKKEEYVVDQINQISTPIVALDTVPNSHGRTERDYVLMSGMYQYLLEKKNEYNGPELSKEASYIIEEIDRFQSTDSLALIALWKQAIERLTSDLTRNVENLETEKLMFEAELTELELIKKELVLSESLQEEGFSSRDEIKLNEAKEMLMELEEELTLLIQKEQLDVEQKELLELLEMTKNRNIILKRRIEIYNNYKAKSFYGLSKQNNTLGLGTKEPIVKTVYSKDLEIIEFNITEKQKRSGDYKLNFLSSATENALVLLDGEMIESRDLKKLQKIDITDLAMIQTIGGPAAQKLYPDEMASFERMVHVMTKGFANSPKGKANTAMFRTTANFARRPAFNFQTSKIYYGGDMKKMLLNGEVRDDLVSSKLFEKYGKRYTSNISIQRDLAIELYGRDFIGTAQGIFFPYIDGKNTSADDLYNRLRMFNDKVGNSQATDEKLVDHVKQLLENKVELENTKNELIKNTAELNEDYIIVLDDYVRKDLSVNDLEDMDISNLQILSGNQAKSLYGSALQGKTHVIKIESSSSRNIEYSNVMDPRVLKENSDPYKVLPFQSEIEEFDNALEKSLRDDGKMVSGTEIIVTLESEKMLIDFEVQPRRVLRRYLKLYEKTMGFPISKEISYYFKK